MRLAALALAVVSLWASAGAAPPEKALRGRGCREVRWWPTPSGAWLAECGVERPDREGRPRPGRSIFAVRQGRPAVLLAEFGDDASRARVAVENQVFVEGDLAVHAAIAEADAGGIDERRWDLSSWPPTMAGRRSGGERVCSLATAFPASSPLSTALSRPTTTIDLPSRRCSTEWETIACASVEGERRRATGIPRCAATSRGDPLAWATTIGGRAEEVDAGASWPHAWLRVVALDDGETLRLRLAIADSTPVACVRGGAEVCDRITIVIASDRQEPSCEDLADPRATCARWSASTRTTTSSWQRGEGAWRAASTDDHLRLEPTAAGHLDVVLTGEDRRRAVEGAIGLAYEDRDRGGRLVARLRNASTASGGAALGRLVDVPWCARR